MRPSSTARVPVESEASVVTPNAPRSARPPLGESSAPTDDVGNAALYLCSDLAAGVTGEIHYVDAGYNLLGVPDADRD